MNILSGPSTYEPENTWCRWPSRILPRLKPKDRLLLPFTAILALLLNGMSSGVGQVPAPIFIFRRF